MLFSFFVIRVRVMKLFFFLAVVKTALKNMQVSLYMRKINFEINNNWCKMMTANQKMKFAFNDFSYLQWPFPFLTFTKELFKLFICLPRRHRT